MPLKFRLLIAFLLVGLIPALVITLISGYISSEALREQAYNQLRSIETIKKLQIKQYFERIEVDTLSAANDWSARMSESDWVRSAHQNQSRFADYIERRGYYDLFLIDDTGVVSYSVTKEADYQSNLVSGPYSDSGLAQLYRQVMETGEYTFSDFQPYAPSGGAPAAFVGAPVVAGGEVQAVLALQLSIDAINEVMNTREGMGRSGESYLVGQDYRMRSDSFLDAQGRSVKASFAGTIADNGIKTKAVTEALAGRSNTEVIIDYNGNPVLSSYEPLDIGDTRWAMVVEIDQQEVFSSVDKLISSMTVLLVLVIAAILLATWWVVRMIITPLGGEPEEMQDISERISHGDLSCELSARGEGKNVYNSMRAMNSNLRQLVGQLSDTVDTLGSTVEQTSASTEQELENNRTQMENIISISTAMQEMSATIDEVAKSARNVADLTHGLEGTSQQTNDSINQTSGALQQLCEEIGRGENTINSLSERSQEIGSVLDVINSIAEQTNLLALNAAIEAARAGDQGRGFAVVADEVRQLAQKTQSSTKDIESMIGMLQKDAKHARESMARSSQYASDTADKSIKSTQALQQTLEQLKTVAGHVEVIATAANEQSYTAQDISKSMTRINDAANDNVATAEQVKAASEELQRLAYELQTSSGRFKLN
ncbi:methyl-accepting chemotaxis protein [Pseudoalteromonas ruthenica]|uniref:Methyl-accepting chemotaxis protein n=1 Tax=Pseudoalteromonas ruthenica TaxID=151081 RepID=A0A5S3Z081_9GAMM|nr:methyl-accepting chemotaxis protein [Pseudoalteromonas ruthenica]TMP85664.1 methyl-accepting chemotaxis protein [Pseudoalteromonas ruthenica]